MMRSISKLQLIRWHYFDNQIIDFKGVSSLITGDNGAGKSTIIDALQVILIANLKNIKFNSSAHDKKSERTLLSYLKGKINNDIGGFIRNNDFTSYLALEINVKTGKLMLPNSYILGVVFDYSADRNEEEHTFFKLDKTMLNDELFFDKNNLPRTSEQFFYNLKINNIDYEKYTTIEKYKSDVLHLLGGIRDNFFSTLSKGIAFSPITNIRNFAYDYILDEQKVDISLMKDYVERTNEFVAAIEKAERQINSLKKIENIYNKYVFAKEEAIVYEYIFINSIIEQLKNSIIAKKEKVIENQNQLEITQDNITKVNNEVRLLNNEIIQLNTELSEHSIGLKKKELEMQIDNINLDIETSKFQNKNILNKLRVEYEQLSLMVNTLNKFNINEELIQKFNIQLSNFKSFIYKESKFSPSLISEYSEIWKAGYSKLYGIKVENDIKLATLHEKKSSINEAIKELEKNQILSEKTPQMRLKKLLEQAFNSEKNSVQINMLCEIIDIKNESWRNAIEGLLNTQKFNIIVPPEYVDAAIQIYESKKKEFNIESVGLVDSEKILNKKITLLPGALAEEISVDNELIYAKAYVNYLMGNVIKCTNVNLLRNHARAVTESCMLYQGYVARQIPKKNFEIPFIGKEAIKTQLIIKQEELKNVSIEIHEIQSLIESLNQVLKYSGDKQERIESYCMTWTEESKLGELEELLHELKTNLYSLDTSPLQLLEKQIDDKRNLITMNEIKRDGLNQTVINISTHINILNNEIKSADEELMIQEGKLNLLIINNSKEVINRANERLGNIEKLNVKSKKYYEDKKSKFDSESNTQFIELSILRTKFNDTYIFAADERNESNDEYEAYLRSLEDSQIVEYKKKAQEAERKAQQSFREDFISKLKDQIEKAKSDFNELNHILKDLKFGNDRYKFKVTGNDMYFEYYKMLTDANLESGFSIFSSTFDDVYSDVVIELFEKISGENTENNGDLLDYRTYLDFELMIIDENGHATPYSKVALEKSGGETQVPFYVSILASFYHTYHMSRKEDTIRLVIFDEAFNRMDSNRVDEAIEFIKSCGFQTLIIAPTGKVALLAPHFDNSIIVMKEQYQSFAVPVTIDEMLEFEVEEYETESV